MANKYKDENGHWTTKENDGGPCHHESGSDKIDTKHGDTKNAAFKVKADGEEFAFDTKSDRDSWKERNKYSFDKIEDIDAFDDDYEEEFEEKPAPIEGDKFSVEGRQFQVTKVDRDGKHIVAKDLKTGEEFDWTKDALLNDESFEFESVFDDESQEEYLANRKEENDKLILQNKLHHLLSQCFSDGHIQDALFYDH